MEQRVRAVGYQRSKAGVGWQLPLLCLLAAVGAVVLFAASRHAEGGLVWLRAEHLRVHAGAAGLGIVAPVAFAMVFAALMLLVWFPTWPCILVGGFLFGTIAGTILSLIASTAGAVAVFALAKSGLAHRMPKGHPLLQRLEAGFQRDALEYVLFLRIMPVVPFGIIHVAAAAFDISLRAFTLGTAIGMIPFIIIYAQLGSDADRIIASGRPIDAKLLTDPSILTPLFGLAALALVPLIVREIRRRLASAALRP